MYVYMCMTTSKCMHCILYTKIGLGTWNLERKPGNMETVVWEHGIGKVCKRFSRSALVADVLLELAFNEGCMTLD